MDVVPTVSSSGPFGSLLLWHPVTRCLRSFNYFRERSWLGVKPNAWSSDMSSSWLKSVGNPLITTLSCLLWAISNVCDRNLLSEIYFDRWCLAETGKLGVFISSYRPSSGVSQNFPTGRGARLHYARINHRIAQCVFLPAYDSKAVVSLLLNRSGESLPAAGAEDSSVPIWVGSVGLGAATLGATPGS
ncbi:hypothetical protein TNIN_219991 [Trichonephila inaurata madagascariensis]|uniref:Uncharacterized protein n=1 Tax=Trichonephila inaurata madagascariensis TaxID=2747483 RepID=A0A8X6IS39_9ARAC|nr:hypothetical protein TNIN_219991 [Trichonephila inaurata madagascariensis]